jgi:hypothetical protein
MTEKLYLVAIFSMITFTSCTYINDKLGQKPDWWGEEVVEEVIESAVQIETGYRPEIDLTPDSPEK